MKPIVTNAVNLARRAHAGVNRKYGNRPYIDHPADVAARVTDYFSAACGFYDPKPYIAAAWAHDVLEDCPQITPEEIEKETNHFVLALVKQLTNPSKGSKAPRAVRKQMDRDHLKNVSNEAKIIKMIDRIVNVNDFRQYAPDSQKDFFRVYASESRSLVEVIGDADEDLKKELLEAIAKLEERANA